MHTPTNAGDEPLPTDISACHQLIVRLRRELAETRRRLAVYEENQRQEFKSRYGRGVTSADLLSFGQAFAAPPPSASEQAAIDAELAAEDAMRRRPGRRKKKT